MSFGLFLESHEFRVSSDGFTQSEAVAKIRSTFFVLLNSRPPQPLPIPIAIGRGVRLVDEVFVGMK